MSHNLQTQLSYTWSRYLDIGSGNYGLEGEASPEDSYTASLGLEHINGYADSTAFSLPPPGTLGNLGRDAFYAPGIVDTDFSVLKDTVIARAVPGGVFQHFQPPELRTSELHGLSAGTDGGQLQSDFGKITSTLTNPRHIQFDLKLIF